MRMERRKLLISIGALGAGGAAAFGTEAFTSIEAERSVDVSVAGDSSAYLAFQALDSSNANDYVSTEGDDTIAIDLDGDGGAGGSGVNQDAITQVEDLFKIVNQGTQPTSVYFEDDSDAVTFRVTRSTNTSTNGSNGQSLEGANNSVELDVGEQVVVGLTIDTLNNDVSGSLLDTVTVYADANPSAPQQNIPQPQYIVDGSGSDPNTFATLSAALGDADVATGSVIGIKGSETVTESSQVTVDKSVTITGFEGTPTVDASAGGVEITADGVTLRNVELKTGTERTDITGNNVTIDGISSVFENQGIEVYSDGVSVLNSTFTLPSGSESNGYAIRFEGGTSNGVARNNAFNDIFDSRTSEFGNGIVVAGPDGHEVVGNLFSSNSIGVNVGNAQAAKELTVKDNSFDQQKDFAVALNHANNGSASFTIVENEFDGDATGILTYGDGGTIDISRNDFANYDPYVDDTADVLDLDAIVSDQGNTFSPDAVAGNTKIVVAPSQDTVLNVADGSTYGDIQSAVDAASSAQTIAAGPGTYNGVDLTVKGITLKGPNAGVPTEEWGPDNEQAVVEGQVHLNTQGVTVNGMTVSPGTAVFDTTPAAAIYSTASDVTIEYNRVADVTVDIRNISANSIQAIQIFESTRIKNIAVENNLLENIDYQGDSSGSWADDYGNLYGIHVQGAVGGSTDGQGVRVSGNGISNLSSAGYILGTAVSGSGSTSEIPDNVTVTANEFDEFVNGQSVPGVAFNIGVHAGNISVTENSLGTPRGVEHKGSGTLDATNNYWGASDGPSGGYTDPDGETADGNGARIDITNGGEVDFSPFRDSDI
jgi:hypothetical protein